jgi:hypothetical protein
MKFEGAVVEENGVKFAVVKVEKDIFEVTGRARDRMVTYQRVFPDMAVVLMSGEPGAPPNFYGRPDIVRTMMAADLDTIKWQEYSLDDSEEKG